MVVPVIIAGIISAIGSIVGAIADTGKAALDLIMQFFQAVFTLLSTFIQAAPTPMKVAVFLFFILSIGNVFSNFLISTRYACDGNNVLYETGSIGTAMTLIFKTQFQDMSVGTRNTFIQDNYELSERAVSPTNIRCVRSPDHNLPKLFFYSVDILDYKTWLLILVIMFGVPMILSYYSKTGILH